MMELVETMRLDVHKGDVFDVPYTNEVQITMLKELGMFLEAEGAAVGNQAVPVSEANNNHLAPCERSGDVWSTESNVMLENLDCWNGGGQTSKGQDNTDGAIYTLTVLNGTEGSSSWYKQEEKEERPTNLDIDSLLNIIPSTFNQQSYQEPKPVYSYEDSGFADASNEDLLFTQEFSQSCTPTSTVDTRSLLRSTIQNKFHKSPIEETTTDIQIMPLSCTYDSYHVSNNSSLNSIDDVILSDMSRFYPEDYEKLKRIETEVAQSAQFYLDQCSYAEPNSTTDKITQKKSYKKYSKRNKLPTGSTNIRKERSLHYCNICTKGFKDKYSVNVHIRTHTGEKPFKCSLCGKSFRQKAHLAKHYQTHITQSKSGGVSSTTKSTKSR